MKTGIFLKFKADYDVTITHYSDGMQIECGIDSEQTNRLFWQFFEHYGIDKLKEMLHDEGFTISKVE